METMEIIAYAMSIVAAYLFLRLFQETITRKNAIDRLDSADLTIATITKNLNTAQRERDTFKCELERANQTIADMMSDLSIARNERHGVVEEMEKVAKERDELNVELRNVKTMNYGMSAQIRELEKSRDDCKLLSEELKNERDELKALAKEIKDDRIRDGIWNIAKKVELREKLEIVKAEIDNIITIDLEEK